MRSAFAILLVLASATFVRAQERWDPAKTYVVLVGITEWKNPKQGYENFPKRGRMDVKLEEQLLESGVPRRNLVLLKDKEATLEAIRRATTDMAKRADGGGTFLFYFNGHGDKDFTDGGRHYLVNYDLDKKDMRATGFAVSELGRILEENVHEGRVLLLGDSCYSGAFSSVVKGFAGSKKVKAASLSSVVSENMAWATNSYSEDLIKIFAGDASAGRDGKVTLGSAADFLREEMRFRENQPAESAHNESFEPDFVFRDVDPKTVLPELPGRWQLRDYVEAKTDGKWYRAQIVDAKDGRYKVRLFARTYDFHDTWVNAENVRPAQFAEALVGDRVEVRSTADWMGKPTWVEGVVTAVRAGFAKLRYGDLPAWTTEWQPTDHLRDPEGRGLNRVLSERLATAREEAVRSER